MQQKAVVDRIVDGTHAVLLVGDREVELVVPLAQLPPGTKEGHWLRVQFEGPTLVAAALDAEETERARQRIARKIGQLRTRGRRDPGQTSL